MNTDSIIPALTGKPSREQETPGVAKKVENQNEIPSLQLPREGSKGSDHHPSTPVGQRKVEQSENVISLAEPALLSEELTPEGRKHKLVELGLTLMTSVIRFLSIKTIIPGYPIVTGADRISLRNPETVYVCQ